MNRANQNSIKQFHKGRKQLNQQICELLGKDAFLHQISNSDSSTSHDKEHNQLLRNFQQLGQAKTPQFNHYYRQNQKKATKIQKKQTGKFVNNQYSFLQHQNNRLSNSFSSVVAKNKSSKPAIRIAQQPITNNHCIKLWGIIKQFIIRTLNSYNKDKISMLKQQPKDQQLLSSFMRVVTQLLSENQYSKTQKSETIKSNNSKLKYSSIIDGSESKIDSFFNIQIDELKEKFEILEKQNKQYVQLIISKDIRINQIQGKIKQYGGNSQSVSIKQQSKEQMDYLKKIAQIRKSQINDLNNKNRNVELQNQNLKQFSQKLKKILLFAKRINDDFIGKYEQQIKETKKQLFKNINSKKVGQYFGKQDLKIQYRNSRFGIVRGRSLEKNFQFNSRKNKQGQKQFQKS